MGYFIVFYTYAHYSPKGDLFYIGKGTGDRAFSFSDRSHDWKRAVKQNKGVQIEILANWDTEEEAYDHEKLLVDCFTEMGSKLVNKTKGGKGAYGVVYSEERKRKLSERFMGFKHKIVTCPHCGTSGGNTSIYRWHFKNCTGAKGKHKARVTIDGKRIYLGYFLTKDEATQAMIEYYKSAGKPLPKEFIRHRGVAK